jgi:hypothetical protein
MNAVSLAQSLVLKSKIPTRKKYSDIDYRDQDGTSVTVEDLALKYEVSERTVTRAFSKFNGDYVEANNDLSQRNIIQGCDRKAEPYMRKDYRDQDGNQITGEECAKIMGVGVDRVCTLYGKHNNDWKYIYENYGATSGKRGRGRQIQYRDADGSKVDLSELVDRYGVGEKTVYRAFVKYDLDPVMANILLCERHLVPAKMVVPSDSYSRRDYRDQYGNPSTRKEVCATMQLSKSYVSYLYEKHNNDWKYLYDNFGKTKVNHEDMPENVL